MVFLQARRGLGVLSCVVAAAAVVAGAVLGLGESGAAPSATTLFVSTSGRNSNPCTQTAPCASFSRAYQVARPGDIVQVSAGDYPAQTLLQDATKTSTSDVVFQPAAGAAVTVRGDLSVGNTASCAGARHLTVRDMRVASIVTRCGAEDVTFERIDASSLNISGGSGISVLGGDYGPISSGPAHVKQRSRDVLIDRARFHDFTITDPAKHSECLLVWEGTTGLTIRNSIFQNCTDFGILVKNASSVLIENSVFDVPMPGNTATASCNPGCPRGGSSLAFSEGSGFVVRYSSFLGGIRVDPEVSNVTLKANVGPLTSCPRNAIYANNVWTTAKCSASDRTASLTDVFLGPNSSGFDLRLKPGAAAIGAGDPADHPLRDVGRQLRPDTLAPDAGAWQRESALAVPGRAVGAARVGMRLEDVTAFYGRDSRRKTLKSAGGVAIIEREHRVRGGKLRLSYRDDVVVAIGTTSPYYRTLKGLTPGATMRPREKDDWTCRPIGAPKGKARLYLRPTRSKTPVVAELIVVAPRFEPPCATAPTKKG